MKKLLLVMMLSLGPMSAQAVPITFNWSNNGSNADLLSGSGSWTLDDSVLTPGSFDYVGLVKSFQFSWNTSAGSFSLNPGTGAIAQARLEFDTLWNLIDFSVCASTNGNCSLDAHPVIAISDNNWVASLSDMSSSAVRVPQTLTQVPEPGTLGLLGVGMLGLAFARRRKSLT